MICDRWDVVAVPFPFTDKLATKRRPAVAVSKTAFNAKGHTVLAMITSASHEPLPGDASLREYGTAGLHLPCLVRLKLFTLDNRLILRKIGHLAPVDQRQVASQLRKFIL